MNRSSGPRSSSGLRAGERRRSESRTGLACRRNPREDYTAFRMRLAEGSGIGTLTRATSIWKYQVRIGSFPSAHVRVQRRPPEFLQRHGCPKNSRDVFGPLADGEFSENTPEPYPQDFNHVMPVRNPPRVGKRQLCNAALQRVTVVRRTVPRHRTKQPVTIDGPRAGVDESWNTKSPKVDVQVIPGSCPSQASEHHRPFEQAATYIYASCPLKRLDLPGNTEFCKDPFQCRRATEKTL